MKFISVPRAAKILFLMMLAGPLVFRGLYVDSYINLHTDKRFFGATQVLANDGVLYAFILSLFYLSFLSKIPRVPSLILRALGFLVFLLCAMDSVVFVCFNSHLTVDDTVAYASYAHKYISQITRKRHIFILVAGLCSIALSARVFVSRYTIQRKAHHILAIVTVLSLLAASSLASNDTYTHSWIYKNVVAYNLEVRSESRGYSEGFVSGFEFDQHETRIPHTPQTPNIIVLMVESLSSYQSKYFSGLNDWTPSLDKIARENIAFKEFYANGFCTNDCYISVLTGQLPLRPTESGDFVRTGPFSGFDGYGESLPRSLSRKGYVTEFLLAGDHGFSGVGDWARGIGFDTLEGQDHPYYDGWDRYQFDSASDEALYARLVEKIEQHQSEKFFMYVSTMSTHHPFVNPDNGNSSEAETFMYADRQLGAFHEKLIEMGFFENGVLIIMGDHHAMVPLKPGEADALGKYRAAAKVPMVVSYGNKKQAVVTGLHQQADIYHSLKNLVSEEISYSDWTGDIFNDKPVKYVAHRRGDYRNRVSVFSQDKDYLVKLDGDKTRVIGGDHADEQTKAELVGRINDARILKPMD